MIIHLTVPSTKKIIIIPASMSFTVLTTASPMSISRCGQQLSNVQVRPTSCRLLLMRVVDEPPMQSRPSLGLAWNFCSWASMEPASGRTWEAPQACSHCWMRLKSSRARTKAIHLSLSRKHSCTRIWPTVLLAPFRMIQSPGCHSTAHRLAHSIQHDSTGWYRPCHMLLQSSGQLACPAGQKRMRAELWLIMPWAQ